MQWERSLGSNAWADWSREHRALKIRRQPKGLRPGKWCKFIAARQGA
jgi:hypothetical protein